MIKAGLGVKISPMVVMSKKQEQEPDLPLLKWVHCRNQASLTVKKVLESQGRSKVNQ